MDMIGYAIGSKDWLSRVAHTRLGEIRPLPFLCTPRRVCFGVFKARYQCFSTVAPAEFATHGQYVGWLFPTTADPSRSPSVLPLPHEREPARWSGI